MWSGFFEIDPTSDSSPWGRRASASLQPGETTFDAGQTARELWQGKTPTRAPALSEFQRYMVERIKAYFQVRWRCVRPWWWAPMAAIPFVRDYSGLPIEDSGAPT